MCWTLKLTLSLGMEMLDLTLGQSGISFETLSSSSCHRHRTFWWRSLRGSPFEGSMGSWCPQCGCLLQDQYHPLWWPERKDHQLDKFMVTKCFGLQWQKFSSELTQLDDFHLGVEAMRHCIVRYNVYSVCDNTVIIIIIIMETFKAPVYTASVTRGVALQKTTNKQWKQHT